eukprot:EG_transcript_33302
MVPTIRWSSRAACSISDVLNLQQASTRAAYPFVFSIPTRLNDMDLFGHINNVIYYEMMDNAVNGHLLQYEIDGRYPRFVAESGCRFLRPLTYPNPIDVGVRVVRLGRSSVAYALGLFNGGPGAERATETPAAVGHFVHVYIDPSTGRPCAIPEKVMELLRPLHINPHST